MLPIKVSIIIPVYKVEPYIEECVSSVLGQTYTNLEIILVDDGSPDKCPMICDSYAQKDNRIKVIHKKNGGLSDARNAGLREATGDYVYFLDSDDTIYPDAIENLVRVVAFQPEVDLVYGGTVLQGEDVPNAYYQIDLSKEKAYYGTPEVAKEAVLFVLPAIACNKLVRLSTILQNKLYFVVGLLHEDEMWRWQIRNHIHQCAICDKSTYWYRQENQGSIVHTKDTTRSLKSKVSILVKMLQTLDIDDKQDMKCIVRFASPGFKYATWDACLDKASVNVEIKRLQALLANMKIPAYLRLLIKLWDVPRWVYDNRLVSTIIYKYGVWWQLRRF